jgi:hypothetical protein
MGCSPHVHLLLYAVCRGLDIVLTDFFRRAAITAVRSVDFGHVCGRPFDDVCGPAVAEITGGHGLHENT